MKLKLRLVSILALSTALVSSVTFSAASDSEEEIKERSPRRYDEHVSMHMPREVASPRAEVLEHKTTPADAFPSPEQLFEFLRENEQSSIGLAKDILEVTQAEPDVPRQVVYVLHKTLSPFFTRNQELRGEFNNLKGTIKDPETLMHNGASFFRDRKTSLSLKEEGVIFGKLDEATQGLTSFKGKLNGASGKFLGQHQEKILASLDRVITFYRDYRAKLLKILKSYCLSEGEERLRLYHQLEDALKPKALMAGEGLGAWSFWRFPQEMGRYIVGVDQYGSPLNTAKDESKGESTSNHYVSFLPNDSASQAKVYFKSQGHPSLNPGKEAMVQSLYRYLQIPIPQTKIIVVKNLSAEDPSAYLLQTSQAINGQNTKLYIKNDPTLKGLDINSYARQVLGAFLTYPSDGKADNFIYQSPNLISIDNDEVFAPAFAEDGTVYVKSLLYLLPQMTEVIPTRTRQLFFTVVPEVISLSFLKDLQRKNTAWKRLEEDLRFLEGIEKREILSSDHVNWVDLAVPVRISSTFFESILQKIGGIQKALSGKWGLTFQDLFNLLDPLLGSYYEELRKAHPNPYEALHVLYTPGNKEPHPHAQIFALINKNLPFSDGRTAWQHFDNLTFTKERSESLPPEVFIGRLKSLWQKQVMGRKFLSIVDSLTETFRQRKKEGLLERSQAFELFQNLQEEGLCIISQPKSMFEFWEEVRVDLANGSQDQLMWDSLFQPFREVNPELAWLFNLATGFSKDWPHTEKYPRASMEILGVSLGKRQLSKEIAQQIFDDKGKFKRGVRLTSKGEVTFYPEAHPRWVFKKYPEVPGCEYAVTSFMKSLGIKKVPFSELYAFYDPQGSLYPVLISETIPGDPLHKVWHNDAIFSQLDSNQTTLLILASMLLNPEDAKEDNFILSQQGGKWTLVPINNDHTFLPGAIYETKGTLVTTIHESLQPKSLVFCLPQMQQTVPSSIREYFCELNIDAFLTRWIQDLIKINSVYESFFPEEMASTLWNKHNSTMRMPLPEVSMSNLYAKFYRLQRLILQNPELRLLDILKKVEPYVGKCSEESFTNELITVRDRFKSVTDAIYQRARLSGASSSAPPVSVINNKQMMKILRVFEIEVKGRIMNARSGPNEAMELFQSLKVQREKDVIALQSLLTQAPTSEEGLDLSRSTADEENKLLKRIFDAENSPEVINLYYSSLLSEDHFISTNFRERGAHLRVLDIRGAKKFVLQDFIALSQVCLSLEYLNMSNCAKIIHIAGHGTLLRRGGPYNFVPVEMSNLKRLLLSHCENLQEIHLRAPELQCLEAEQCASLTKINLETPRVQIMSLSPWKEVSSRQYAEIYKIAPALFTDLNKVENGDKTELIAVTAKVPVERLEEVCRNARSFFTKHMSMKDKVTLIEATTKVPAKKLEEVCRNTRSLFTESMSVGERVSLIEAMAKAPIGRVEEMCRNARFLFIKGMDGEERARLIEAAAKISARRADEVCRNASFLFNEHTRIGERIGLIEAVAKIPAERLEEVCQNITSLFTEGMNVWERARLIETVAKIPAGRVEEVCRNSPSLFTGHMSIEEQASLIEVVAKIPAGRVEEVCKNAHFLFIESMDGDDRVRLIETAARVPIERLEGVCRNITPLFTKGMNTWERVRLIEATAKIPTERFREIFRKDSFLFTASMSGGERASLIEAAANVSTERWEEVCKNAPSLFIAGMSGWELAKLIVVATNIPVERWNQTSFIETAAKVASKVPAERWEGVYRNTRSLLTENMSGEERTNLVEAVAKIPAERLEEVCQNITYLFTEGMNVWERARLIETVAKIPAGRVEEVCRNANFLFTEGMNGWERVRLIEVATKVSTERWEEVCRNVPSLFTASMSGGERAKLIEVATKVSTAEILAERLEEVCRNASSLFVDGMNVWERASLIEAAASIPAEQWDQASFIEAAAKIPAERWEEIYRNTCPFFTESMSGEGRARLIEAAAKVPAERLEEVCKNTISLFTEGMNGWERTNLLQTAAKIPAERVEEVCRNARSLFTERMSGGERSSLLHAVAKIPAGRLEEVCRNAPSLFTENMSGWEKAKLIEIAAKVSAERLEEMCRDARFLFADSMNEWERASLIEAAATIPAERWNQASFIETAAKVAARIPAERWEEVYRNTRPLFTEGMSGDERASLIEVTAKIPTGQVEEVCQNITSLFTENMSGWERIRLVEGVAKIPAGRVEEVCRNVSAFFTKDMSEWERVRLIEAVAKIPTGRVEEVYRNVNRFFIENIDGRDRASLIEVAAKVPAECWEEMCRKASSLFTERMSVGEQASLIEAATKVPTECWEEVHRKASSLFTASMSGWKRTSLIEAAAENLAKQSEEKKGFKDNGEKVLEGSSSGETKK